MDHASNAHEQQEKVIDLIDRARFCMITVAAADGRLVSRPMTPMRTTAHGQVWFLIDRTGEQARQISERPQVNLAISGSSSWLSISGRGEILHDPQQVRELWTAAAQAWFPDGPQDPRLGLLRVQGVSAEYWDVPGGRIATVISFLKAKATGEPMDADNARVELGTGARR